MSTGGDGYFNNLRTVGSDPRLAYLLLREARCRALERVFGVPRGNQFLLNLVLLGVAGKAITAGAQRVLSRLPGRPDRNGVLVGTSLLDEAAHMLAGDATPDAPLVGTLVAFALLTALVRPGIHDIRAAARTIWAELARIPQYIVRLNHSDAAHSSGRRREAEPAMTVNAVRSPVQ